MNQNFSRRAFLRGLGACIALPSMESLLPGAKAATAATGASLATTPSGNPLRLGFVAFGNGAHTATWRPTGVGRNFSLAEGFAPVKDLQSKFQIISHLAADAAKNWGDGAGDHARAGASFLTGQHAWKTLGDRLHLGISVDQLAAQQVGHLTRISSMQLGVEGERLYGACDSGYPCAYQYNISWASETLPLAPEANPRTVFEKLFGEGSPADREATFRRRLASRKSVLDFVLQDVRSMNRGLGHNDRQKLDEYLSGVRSIEQQIEQAERFRLPKVPGEVVTPAGIPGDHARHVELMYDLMAMAYQTDSTRVITYVAASEGSNRPFLDLGISEGHHFLTHHRGNEDKIAKVVKIERWYMEKFGNFMRKLDAMKEPDGSSVLDNSMILYGSALGDGDRHNHDELPIMLAGGGGGLLNPGQHVEADRLPVTNLYLAMLERMGVKAQKVGDSTGRLETI